MYKSISCSSLQAIIAGLSLISIHGTDINYGLTNNTAIVFSWLLSTL